MSSLACRLNRWASCPPQCCPAGLEPGPGGVSCSTPRSFLLAGTHDRSSSLSYKGSKRQMPFLPVPLLFPTGVPLGGLRALGAKRTGTEVTHVTVGPARAFLAP